MSQRPQMLPVQRTMNSYMTGSRIHDKGAFSRYKALRDQVANRTHRNYQAEDRDEMFFVRHVPIPFGIQPNLNHLQNISGLDPSRALTRSERIYKAHKLKQKAKDDILYSHYKKAGGSQHWLKRDHGGTSFQAYKKHQALRRKKWNDLQKRYPISFSSPAARILPKNPVIPPLFEKDIKWVPSLQRAEWSANFHLPHYSKYPYMGKDYMDYNVYS